MSWDCNECGGNTPCELLSIHEPDLSMRLLNNCLESFYMAKYNWRPSRRTVEVPEPHVSWSSQSVCSYTEIVIGWWEGRAIVRMKIVEVTGSPGLVRLHKPDQGMKLENGLSHEARQTTWPWQYTAVKKAIWLNVHGYLVRLWSLTCDQGTLRALRRDYSLQFALWSLQCAVGSLQFAVCSLQFAFCSLQFTLFSLQFAFCSSQFALCSLQFEVGSLQFAVCTLQFEGYIELVEIQSLGKHRLIKVNDPKQVMEKSHTEF